MAVLKACTPPSAYLNHSIPSPLVVISADWLVGGLGLHPIRVQSLIWKVSTGLMLFFPTSTPSSLSCHFLHGTSETIWSTCSQLAIFWRFSFIRSQLTHFLPEIMNKSWSTDFYSLYVTWLVAKMPEANYLLSVSLGYIKVWHIDSS